MSTAANSTRDAEVDEFLSKTIQQNSFTDIINSEAKLSKEIKQLDVQMQQLVYDNYTHFIDASKTIRSTIPGLKSMKEDVAKLRNLIREGHTESEGLSNAILNSNPELLSVIRKQKLMVKIDELVALPAVMQENIAQNKLMDAVLVFNNNQLLLNQYKAYPQVQKVLSECGNLLSECEKKVYAKLKDYFDLPADDVNHLLKILLMINKDCLETFKTSIASFFFELYESTFTLSDTSSFLSICDEVSSLIIPKASFLFEEMQLKLVENLKVLGFEETANQIFVSFKEILSEKNEIIFKAIKQIITNNQSSVEGNTVVFQLNAILMEFRSSKFPIENKIEIDKCLSSVCFEVFGAKIGSNFEIFTKQYNECLEIIRKGFNAGDLFDLNPSLIISDATFTALNGFQSCFDGFKAISSAKYGFIHLPNFFQNLSKLLSEMLCNLFNEMLGSVIDFVENLSFDTPKDFLLIMMIYAWTRNYFKNSFHSFVEIANGHLSMPPQCSITIKSISDPLRKICTFLQSKFVFRVSYYLFSFIANSVSKNHVNYQEPAADVRAAFITLNKSLRDFQVLFSAIQPKIKRLMKSFDPVSQQASKCKLKFVFESEADTMTQVLRMLIISIKSSLLQTTLNTNGVHQLQVDLRFIQINLFDIFKNGLNVNELHFDEIQAILRKRCIESNLTMLSQDEISKLINTN